jgi:polyphosphate kinase
MARHHRQGPLFAAPDGCFKDILRARRSLRFTRKEWFEVFCIHARNLDEFFQGSRRADSLKAKTFADGKYKPLPRDKERKDLIAKINKQIAHLTEQRTSMAAEKIGPAERARLHSILIAEADSFTRHLLPKLRLDWEYVPSA